MALNNKFNAKNGISVGIPSVSVVDNVGNAIFPTVSARQYLGLQPSLSGLAALVDGNSLGSALTIGTNDNFNLNLETAGTTKMTVTSAGNVGLGIASPSERLTVSGSISSNSIIYAAGGNSGSWNSNYTTTNGNSANWNSAYTTTNTNSAKWSSVYTTVNTSSASYIVNGGNTIGSAITIGTNDANNFNLETSGTARVSISSTGQVGIGTTTPDADLVVYKNVIGTPATLKIRTATTTASRLDFFRTDAYVATRFDVLSTNEFQFYNNNDVTTPKYIVNGTNGNFGIGTTNTAEKVTIGGNLSASGILYGNSIVLPIGGSANWNSVYTTTNTNSANWNSVYTTVNTSSATYILAGGNTRGAALTIGTNDNFNLSLETAGTTQMTITSAGNIGIGTTAPNERLTVVGNISAVGDIAVSTSLQGVILVAPNSSRWRITITNTGALSTTLL